ncbi:MAG: hypothetical protein HFE43_00755 [Oscillospiraceae bacterium]|jgi:hypothetical protein|nr:hypothetical protein [Oscillospiraceae bacterium]
MAAAAGALIAALLFLMGAVFCVSGILVYILCRMNRRGRPWRKRYIVISLSLAGAGLLLTLPLLAIRLPGAFSHTDYGENAYLYHEGPKAHIEYQGEQYYSVGGALSLQEGGRFRLDHSRIEEGEAIASVKDAAYREYALLFRLMELIFGAQDHGALRRVENPGGEGILLCGNGLYCREPQLTAILEQYSQSPPDTFPYNVLIPSE